MSRQARFLCGVPKDSCVGGFLSTDQKFSTNKCHATRVEAMQCMSRYLIQIGYVRLSSREFVNPQNGYIRMLSKRARFGGRLRSGKGGDKARFEPESGKGHGTGSGLIW